MKPAAPAWFLCLLLLSLVPKSPGEQSGVDAKRLADIRAKAEQGDAHSQFELGDAFAHGRFGVAGALADWFIEIWVDGASG
jgi:hypothetical protein